MRYEFRVEAQNPDARVEWLFPDFEGLRQPQEGAPETCNYLIEDLEWAIAVSEGAVPLIAMGTGTGDYQPAVANVQTPMGNRRSLSRRMRSRRSARTRSPDYPGAPDGQRCRELGSWRRAAPCR